MVPPAVLCAEVVVTDNTTDSAPKPMTVSGNAAASVTLFGALALVMVLFYLTNSRNKVVSSQTWSMISMAVSIFSAVLTFSALDGIIKRLFKLQDASDGAPVSIGDVASLAFQMCFWWFIVVVVLFCQRSSLLHLKAYGTIGGHIMGFTAINLYGNVALMDTFNGNAWMTLVVMAIYLVTVPLVLMTSRLVHGCMQKQQLQSKEDDDRWHDQSKDTGSDFFSMGLASLLCMWIRFLILGSAPSIEGEGIHAQNTTFMLAAISLVLLVLAGSLTAFSHKLHEQKHPGMMATVVDVLTSVTALTAAFTMLSAANWRYNAM
jgi:hypothetical protein